MRWHPDTCECVLECSHIGDDGYYVVTKIEKVCQMHSGIFNLQELSRVVTDDNRKKNQVLKEIMAIPELTMDVPQSDGTVAKVMKAEYRPEFNYDVNRNLDVDLKFIPEPHRTSIKNTLKSFSKVKIKQ